MTATQVYNLGRALEGVLPLTSKWKNVPVKLYEVQRSEIEKIESCEAKAGYVVYDKSDKLLKVKCADGNWISIRQVGVVGKRTMSATDFNNGYVKKEIVDNRYLT